MTIASINNNQRRTANVYFYIFYNRMLRSAYRACSSLGNALVQSRREDCITDVTDKGDRDAAVDSVVALADYCEEVLALAEWPARRLCSRFSNTAEFPMWIGAKCDKPCYFGTADSDDREVCVCNEGYWNVSCDSECPGGAASLCSGFGPCNTNTGRCECPENRRGSDDCSACSGGWHGTDCSVMFHTTVTQARVMAKLTDTGHAHTVDGLDFRLTNVGEYHVLNLLPFVMVQGKFIRCHEHFSCVAFISVRLGDDTHGYSTLTVRVTPDMTFDFTLNEFSCTIDRTLYFHGFNISRLSASELGVNVGSDFQIIIRAVGIYIHTSFMISRDLINATDGILSGRGSRSISDATGYVLSSDGYIQPLHVNDYSTSPNQKPHMPQTTPASELPLSTAKSTRNTQIKDSGNASQSALNEYIDKWRVDSRDMIISYPTVAHQAQTAGGYSLKFHNTSAYSVFRPQSVISSDVTFELFVKAANGSGSGVLFSYASSHVFAVVSLDSLVVLVNGTSFDTGLSLQEEEWNKVVIAYKGETGMLDSYVFNSDGVPRRDSIMLPTDMFTEDGTLALGQWQPPRNGRKLERPDSFDGAIDSFLVWGIRVEIALIKDVWNMNLHDAANLLNANWQFDDGRRYLAVDSLQGYGLRLPGRPWISPQWVPSDIPARKTIDVNPLPDTCKHERQRLDATTVCEFLIRNTSMTQQCMSLNSAVIDMYMMFCQQEVCINNGDMSTARKVALDFADVCMYTSSLAAWPGLEVCDTGGDLRRGTQCYDECRFGTTSTSGQCDCDDGYTGPHCDELCPGGTRSPCSLHGRCTVAGDCDCEHNWQGHDCNSCAENWYGSDCSVLVVTSSLQQYTTTKVAFVTPTATYHTFDQVQFVVGNKIGVFSALQLSGDRVKLQIHQVLCDLPACVDAVALQVDGDSVTVYAETDTKYWPSVYVGRTKISYGEMSMRVSNNVDINLLSTEKITMHVKEPYLLNVTVYLMHHFLHVTVEVDGNICQTATGLLGSCDDNSDNDVPFNMSTASLDSIAGDVSQQYEVTEDKSLFDVRLLKRLSQAGYAMSLNNTATTSAVLSHSFSNATSKTSTGSSNKDVTVSLLVKPLSYGGTVLSYGRRKTFALINDVNVTICCGQDSVVTSSSNSLGEWNQLVLAYERDNRRLHYYHMNAVGAFTYEAFNVDCADFMDIGGRVTLGSWQAAGDNVKHTVTPFAGQIDDLSVWLTQLPHAVIYQLFHLNVRPSVFASNLAYLYTFIEDDGPTARDVMGVADFHGAQSPWQHPTWLPSDLDVYDLPLHAQQQPIRNNDLNAQGQIDAICDSFFKSSVVKSSGIDTKICDHFHSQCLQSGRRSANMKNAYFTMASFAELSRVVSTGHNDFHTVLCTGSKTLQPQWLRRQCAACLFGALGDDGKCKCFHGYWGPSCTNQCPGDRGAVCSGHGECLPDGLCHCEAPYTGIVCENISCMGDSFGANCIVTQMLANQIGVMAVAFLRSQATVFTLDATTFQLPLNGVYEVFAVKSFRLWATVINCDTPTRTARCFDSVLLSFEGKQVLVNRSSSSTGHMTVWADGHAIDVRSRDRHYGIDMVRTATNTLDVSVERLHTLVSVEIDTNGLTATLLTTKSVWKAATGLVSSCNTSVSIQATSCSDVLDPCTKNALPQSCLASISVSTVRNFTARFLRSDADPPANIKSIATSIYCDGSGMFTDYVIWLPRDGFGIEMHIKPLRYGGVIFSYTNSHVLAVVNDVTGLHVHYNNHIYSSGLVLALNMWSQLDLYWDVSMATLHVYLTSPAGVTRVFAVQLTASAFSPSGTMSFGQLPANVADVVNATFVGYLAEVRLWTRPYSGGVLVAGNWRVAVTDTTPDLAHYWKLNEARGTVAFDVKAGQSFRAISELNPPVWSVSDLQLTEVTGITKSDFASESFKTASDRCAAAMAQATCVADKELAASYLQQCVNDVMRLTSIGTIQHAADLYDKACRRLTVCTFGDYDAATQSCRCRRGFWGDNCTDMCSTAVTGRACNDHGQCEQATGRCVCQSRWMSVTVPFDKLTRRMSLVAADYPCNRCTTHWHGVDCNTAADGTATKWYTGVVTGSYVTTLDGATFEVVMPGSFQLLQTDDVSVQVLFVPCNDTYRCRQLVEVSVRSRRALVSIQNNAGQLTGLSRGSTGWVPLPRDRKTTVGDLSVRWKLDNVIRVTVRSGFHIIVAVIHEQLICGVKISKRAAEAVTYGLLGKANGNWKDDVNFGITDETTGARHTASDDVVIDTQLSNLYITRNVKRLFGDSSHLSHDHSKRDMSGGGHVLRINGTSLRFDCVDIVVDMLEFSVSFWLKLYSIHVEQNPVSRRRTLLVINTTGGDIHLDVFKSHWHILWGGSTHYNTHIDVTFDTWLYVTLGWDGRQGGLLTVLIAGGDVNQTARHSRPGVHAYRPVRVTSISFGAPSQSLAFDLDFFTMWTYSRPENTIKEHLYVYTDDYVPDLLAAVLFDEGHGQVVKMTVYDNISVLFNQPQPRYVHGNLYGDNETTSTVSTWLPCDIPGLSLPLSSDLSLDTSSQTVIETCVARLHSNEAIRQNAADLSAVSQFYLEACVKDVSRNGTATMTETAYTFYVQGVKDVDPCLLSDYLDFCVDGPDHSIPTYWYIWVPGLVVLAIVALLLFLVGSKRAKRKREARRCGPEVTGVEGPGGTVASQSIEWHSGEPETIRMSEFTSDEQCQSEHTC